MYKRFPIHSPTTGKGRKYACINVQNNDEYCFKWAIISEFYPIESHSYRIMSYNIVNIEDETIRLKNNIELNFKDLNFPLAVNQIKVFETNNPETSFNMFAVDNENNIVGPYYFPQQDKPKHIDLLLLEKISRYSGSN